MTKPYSELIKNFSRIRGYMREFFVYGFRSREEIKGKSARSYDNERRRIESYLGDVVSFKRGKSGKHVFFSMDSRDIAHNPLYAAFKAKSFTARDITLHFLLLDILSDRQAYTLPEIADAVETEYLAQFEEVLAFDESTIRNKLKEYAALGLIVTERENRVHRYRLSSDRTDLKVWEEAVHFYTEESPLGVIGSFLLDRMDAGDPPFRFRNHYFMNACDEEVVERLLLAIHTHRAVRIRLYSRRADEEHEHRVIPVKLLIGSGGRNFVACRGFDDETPLMYRIDYIRQAHPADEIPDYAAARERIEAVLSHTWGVSFGNGRTLEHISFDLHVEKDEQYIVGRLLREKRCGHVTQTEDTTWRFTADVYDAFELIPWIRTFTGRILRIESDNERVKERLSEDLAEMALQYGEAT
ncbi:MAG: WYL domain-containing protein [Lachnospiraceae bacterium]|nr:WYL domain-containing protein [Lachnospiraceae bacterium]